MNVRRACFHGRPRCGGALAHHGGDRRRARIGRVTALNDLAKRLIDEKTFAVVATVNPDGSPQSSVIWIKRDGDEVLFSTIRGRRKTRNLERDPRVSVTLYDPADPYRNVELRGPA